MLTDLYELRVKANLTQQQLADLSGLSKTTIHQIENGQVDPRVGTLCIIAHALNVPREEFVLKMINEEDFKMKKGHK